MTQKPPRQAIALTYDGQQAPTLSAKGDDALAEAILALPVSMRYRSTNTPSWCACWHAWSWANRSPKRCT